MAKKNICKLSESENHINYQATCSCIGKDHHQNIWIELEDDLRLNKVIFATFFYEVIVSDYWRGFWCRLKIALKVLLGQKVEAQGDFVFDEEGLRHYIDALEEGYNKIKNRNNGS